MKKSFLSIVFIVLFSVFIPFSTLADPSSIGYGGSTTTSPDTYGHWVANRDGSWSFISNEPSTPLYGWIVSKHQWYYIAANGRMATGWQKINFDNYYFSEKTVETQPLGSLYMNKITPDGFRVDSKGIWVR